jgi:hypothetical protein
MSVKLYSEKDSDHGCLTKFLFFDFQPILNLKERIQFRLKTGVFFNLRFLADGFRLLHYHPEASGLRLKDG